MNKTFRPNYLAKNFEQIKNELKNYAKRYYGDQFNDLSEANINSFLIDSVAYVGDILSFYTDYQANESFLSTAIEPRNVNNLAASLGFKPSNNSTTVGKIAVYMVIPANSDGTPDYSSVPIIKKGTVVTTSDKTKKFIINEDIIIDENLIGTNYVVARTNTVGNITYFAIKFHAQIISGTIEETTINVGDFVKFNRIALPVINVAEIISIIDSEGNEYFEVPNLTQNIIYKSVLNVDSGDSLTKYSLIPFSAQRRFVFTEFDGISTLLFGARRYTPDEDLTINPIAEPTKFVVNRYNNDYLQDSSFEPNKLINGDNFGIGPENTTLTIRYRQNNAQFNNAATGEIVNITNLVYQFKKQVAQEIINTILESIQIFNEEPIVGNGEELTRDDIRDLSGMIYQAQNRAVTSKDYEALIYSMPSKYGSIKRVKAERDPRSLKNNINIYVVCSDNFGGLATANNTLKLNIKNWLSGYKMITDTVDIIDAKIINFGIDYTILVDPRLDKLEVNDAVLTQLRQTYSLKSQIGQSFSYLDVYREIQKIDGVLDVKEVKVINKTDVGYSTIPFDVEQNTTRDGNLILIPRNAIYEIKDPLLDIVGKVV